MNVAFYDILATGHHSEYIDHIVEGIINLKDTNDYFFIVHPNFKELFPEIISKSLITSNIIWISISKEEFNNLSTKNFVGKSFRNYFLLQKYAKEINAKKVTLLYFNNFILPLLVFRPGFSINGILFQQFTRAPRKKISQKIIYSIKFLATAIYRMNSQIENIFILNDQKSVCFLNRIFITKKFQYLCDPIPIIKSDPKLKISNHYNFDEGKTILLHFGSLGDRKGTFQILSSLIKIPKKIRKQLILLIIGKCESEEVSNSILKEVKKVNFENTMQVIFHNDFVSKEHMKSLFEQSHIILATQKNSHASSGVIGHAIASNKIVITTNSGLIGELVANYKKGILIDDISSDSIAKGIIKGVNFTNFNNLTQSIDYFNKHNPKSFFQTILN